jgi:hypothetical protein
MVIWKYIEMKIGEDKYKKFYSNSPVTKKRITDFAHALLSWIEIYNENQFPFPDNGKDGFSYEEIISLTKKLNEFLDNIIIGIPFSPAFWDGPPNNKIKGEEYISLKYKPEACSVLKLFLEEVDSTNKNTEDFQDEQKREIRVDSNYYIVKINDDFKYKGIFLVISKDTDYYKCFDALYFLASEGGEPSYKKLGEEIRKRLPKARRMSEDKFKKFILRNLTDEHNGFLRYARIKNIVSGGKKLIGAIRGKGIEFNNRKGN